MKKFHQRYKNSKSRNKKNIVVSYHYEELILGGRSGYGYVELSLVENFKLNTTIIQKHIEKTLLEDNQIKASVVILGIGQL